MFLDNLIPFARKNAISETSFALFLDTPFENPSEIATFFKDNYSERFHDIRVVKNHKFSFTAQDNEVSTSANTGKIVGFSMSEKDEDKERWLVRADLQNEIQRLAINCLVYKDWFDYKTYILSFITEFSSKYPSIEVRACALAYVDQFSWIDDSFPDLSEIFVEKSEVFPVSIIQANRPWGFNLRMNKPSAHDAIKKDYQDVIETGMNLNLDGELNIFLAHNTVQEFDTPLNIIQITESYLLDNLLEFAHSNNKKVVSSIFTESVLKKMGVKDKNND